MSVTFSQSHYTRLQHSCASAKVIAVTKYGGAELIQQCVDAGVTDIGESRVADALAKQDELGLEADRLRWHFIGHLQSKKVAKTVGRFHLIHSVDSTKLAEKLSQANEAAGVTQAVLLQVNVANEPQKYGFTVDELEANFAALANLPALSVKGLMCMAPHEADESTLHEVFGGLATLKSRLEATHRVSLPHLSMGMSNDYPIALEHGATLVRLGRVLLESPNP